MEMELEGSVVQRVSGLGASEYGSGSAFNKLEFKLIKHSATS